MSDTALFLCGALVLTLVVSAIILMVSTIYRVAQWDERETSNDEKTRALGRGLYRLHPTQVIE